ncbi:Uncharacterised protein [Klebsiella pneumoniae]|nr:Uncharacterised protein [Klebsiella pneumoniae]SXN60900.1 Uncharacterised protein [Klebsiella pneumoniae]SXN63404.1 Uncharacterised protein [Klebsiella pneumoniae]VTO25932.1 Uncharacterised protein [Klebsiella pneumoniae]
MIRGSVTAQSINKLFSNHIIFIENRYLIQCFKVMLVNQSSGPVNISFTVFLAVLHKAETGRPLLSPELKIKNVGTPWRFPLF